MRFVFQNTRNDLQCSIGSELEFYTAARVGTELKIFGRSKNFISHSSVMLLTSCETEISENKFVTTQFSM